MSKTPKTLNSEEATKLVVETLTRRNGKCSHYNQIRNHLMVLCMLDAGVRVGELVQLRVNSFMFADEVVGALVIPRTIAKMKSERTIPLTTRLVVGIRAMIKYWSKMDRPLFYQYAFRPMNKNRSLTTFQIQRILGGLSIRAIGRKVSPHVLRHTFGTRLMRTTNSRVVQQLLGHKQLTSTQIYSHPNGDDLLKAINSLNS